MSRTRSHGHLEPAERLGGMEGCGDSGSDPGISELRVVVVREEGEGLPFSVREIAPVGEHNIVASALEAAGSDEDPTRRDEYARLIEAPVLRAVPYPDLAAFEIVEVTWNADVLAVPPWTVTNPTSSGGSVASICRSRRRRIGDSDCPPRWSS